MAYILKTMYRGARLASPYQRFWGSTPSPLVLSEEVRAAKSEDKPIVALESTIITHGMPYPKNLETALEVENIIRQRGAVPATIAILKGQLTVGLTDAQIQSLAQAKGVVKASRRDMAPIVASGLDGATTVAGTIIAAELADIPIFVTGGIGGVHREGENTLDISADLNELGRSKTLVVCSGVKSILDIGRTLEYLETQGVCVCAFGHSTDFPAFYTVRSGHRAPYNIETAEQAARVLIASRTLQLSSGIVVAVPVPNEFAMDETVIENAIDRALKDSKEKGVHGKEVTPFILAAVAEATKGASLQANIALIKNNAKVGADIAVEFKKLKNLGYSTVCNIGFHGSNSAGSRRHFHTSCTARRIDKDLPFVKSKAEGDVLVIGGANVDRTYRVSEDNVQLDGSTHPCSMEQCGGGVGRNMAEALWRMRKGKVRLLTAVGDDADGSFLTDIAPGLLLDGCIIKGGRTATYAAVMDSKGECLMGLGDMALHNHISIDLVNRHKEVLEQAPLVVIDGNIPQLTMDHVLKLCHEIETPVFFEPTDKRKAVKALGSNYQLTYASPNLAELKAMAAILQPSLKTIDNLDEINEVLQLSKIVLQKIEILIVTIGAKGVLTIRKNLKDLNALEARLYHVKVLKQIQNVSGAGDCFASGFIHGILSNKEQSLCAAIGLQAATSALMSKNPVPMKFTVDNITKINYNMLDTHKI